MSSPKTTFFHAILLACLFALSACAGTRPQSAPPETTPVAISSSGSTQEAPLAPEINPVGDIPDTQTFVPYADSTGGYSLDVPEGWARTTSGSSVRFDDKFDGLSVTLTSAASAPTAGTVAQNELASLAHSGRAFQIGKLTDLDLPGGHALKIASTINSEADAVTGKQVRLEMDIYLFYKNGTEAMLQLWAPQGADNVDQWNRISGSFQWK
jgi:hypothetical protein